jgi:hypothetical protein
LIDFAETNPERVVSLKWIQSPALTTENLAAEGGTPVCGDPLEYFGQAYGAEATLPAPVVSGHLATLVRCGYDAVITGGAVDCSGAAQYPVATQYHWYSGAQADQVRVTRSFQLNGTPSYPQSILRAYVPRLPASAFSSIIYPNQANTAITTSSIINCASDCLISVGTTWSGRWFADLDPATGRAMIVLRDASATIPARLAGNHDGLSNSNLTSFQLYAIDAWPSTLTETEYLCFADLTTWPQADRDLAKLPAGCGP